MHLSVCILCVFVLYCICGVCCCVVYVFGVMLNLAQSNLHFRFALEGDIVKTCLAFGLRKL